MNISELRQQLETKSKALATFEIGDTLTVEKEQEFTALEKDVNDIVSKIETLERIEKTKLETAERLEKIATPSIVNNTTYAEPKVKESIYFTNDRDAYDFAKALLTKTSTTINRGDAGNLVAPPIVAQTIFAPDLSYGVAASNVNYRSMTRDTESLVIVDPTVASFKHRGETEAVTKDAMKTSTVDLVVRQFGASIAVSNELIETSFISVADTVVDLTRRALNRKMDELVFSYTGTAAQEGIKGIPSTLLGLNGTVGNIKNITSVTTWAATTLADLNALKANVPVEGYANAKWYCSPAVYSAIFLRLFQAGGGNTVATLSSSGVMTFLGHEIVLVDTLTSIEAQNTPAILFGNLRNSATLGVLQELKFVVDTMTSSANNITNFHAFSRMTHAAYNLGFASATANLRKSGYVSMLYRAGS